MSTEYDNWIWQQLEPEDSIKKWRNKGITHIRKHQPTWYIMQHQFDNETVEEKERRIESDKMWQAWCELSHEEKCAISDKNMQDTIDYLNPKKI